MIDFEDLAKKMVLSKFKVKDENKVIFGSSETTNYPKLIEDLLNEADIDDYNEYNKYFIYRCYFDRVDKACKKEKDQVVIMTDLNKREIILSCINIIKDCCTNEHEFIKFNINVTDKG